MRDRLRRKVDEVVQAFDRDLGRRNTLRNKLFCADAEVLLAAIDCFGSAEGAAFWLTSPEVGLGDEAPLDVAATAEGKERVLQLLWRLNLGMFAREAADEAS
jgi:putative toxin-antitoxin system antitoxin component (TIGR02293 family)